MRGGPSDTDRCGVALIMVRGKTSAWADVDEIVGEEQSAVDRPGFGDTAVGIADVSGPSAANGYIEAGIDAIGASASDGVRKDDGGTEENVGIVNVAEGPPPIGEVQAYGTGKSLREADLVSRGLLREDSSASGASWAGKGGKRTRLTRAGQQQILHLRRHIEAVEGG